ncbi:No apical meristem-associated [Abeliophyllum distichum]|uniref:No apical meristem-associated n=1 Tax=Abeliophyllum distichum TaxID=126358 RepID=A0ABD1VTU1_9LAMI
MTLTISKRHSDSINLEEDRREAFGSINNPMQYEKPVGRKAAKQDKKDKNAEYSNSQSWIANSVEAMAAQTLNRNVSRATFYEDRSKMQRLNWELNIMNKYISTLSLRMEKYFRLKQNKNLAYLDAPQAPQDNPKIPNSDNSN